MPKKQYSVFKERRDYEYIGLEVLIAVAGPLIVKDVSEENVSIFRVEPSKKPA